LGAGAMEYGNRKSAKAAEEDRAKALQRAMQYSGILGQDRPPGIMGGAARPGPTMNAWQGLPRTQQENAVIRNLIQGGYQDKAVGMIEDRMKPQTRKDPITINNQLVDPYTYDVIRDLRTPQEPDLIERKYDFFRSPEGGNLSHGDAMDMAFGNIRPYSETNPLNGQVTTYRINLRTGLKEPFTDANGQPTTPADFPADQPGAPAPQPAPGGNPIYSAPLLSQVGNLGGVPAVQEFGARATAGAYDAGQNVNVPRQNFRLLKQSIYSMYGGSKMSNQDKQELDATLASLGFFESPERGYDALATWYAKAQAMEAEQTRVMNDSSLPVAMRQDAAKQVDGAREVMRILGNPAEIPRPSGGNAAGLPRVSTPGDYNAIKSGAQYLDPDGNVRTKR